MSLFFPAQRLYYLLKFTMQHTDYATFCKVFLDKVLGLDPFGDSVFSIQYVESISAITHHDTLKIRVIFGRYFLLLQASRFASLTNECNPVRVVKSSI